MKKDNQGFKYHLQSARLRRSAGRDGCLSPRLPPVKHKKKHSKRCYICAKKTGLATSYQCRYCTNLRRFPFFYNVLLCDCLLKNLPIFYPSANVYSSETWSPVTEYKRVSLYLFFTFLSDVETTSVPVTAMQRLIRARSIISLKVENCSSKATQSSVHQSYQKYNVMCPL